VPIDPANVVNVEPGILARGPWELDRVEVRWRKNPFEPDAGRTAAADAAIAALRERHSPAHDGVAARLVGYEARDGGLLIELQPIRWALRLLNGDASQSVATLCLTRAADGRWLAGRRAPWVASWPGRWALGAGGSVEVGENPADTLLRELREEWSVEAERARGEALVCLPHQLVMFVGMAWLPEGAEVTPDDEHDSYTWWPADVAQWPDEADEPLRRMASFLA
jgi:ADP-ribose pyrophosphatase YjhB (NUDIX family)